MINHTFLPRPSTFDNEDLWSSLEEQPSIGDRFFGVSCPIRLCAQLPGSNGFYCAQEASGYDSKPVDQSIEAKFYPINCWNNSHWMISCWKRLVTFGRKVASLLAQFSQPTEAVSSARNGDSPSVVQ